MNVASLDNCKELFGLSGWEDIDHQGDSPWNCPAYDLGYLLRKLPQTQLPKHVNELNQGWEIKLGWNYKTQYWYAGYGKDDRYFSWYYEADTPEDALCLLAIELFKQKVLA